MSSAKRAQAPAEELSLLLCSGRTDDDARNECLRRLLTDRVDWKRQMLYAARQRMLSPLCASVAAMQDAAVPSHARKLVEAVLEANVARSRGLVREMIAVIALLEAHDIRAVPWRGSAIGILLDGSLELRAEKGLDLFVHRDEFERAKKVLATSGFHSLNRLKGAQRRAFDAIHCVVELAKDDDDLTIRVRLNHDLAPPRFGSPLDTRQFWERLGLARVDEREIPSLGAEDLLIAASVRGVEQGWAHLGLVHDIARLAARSGGLDWKTLARRAESGQVERMVLVGIELARGLFGAAIPPWPVARAQANQTITSAVAAARGRFFGKPEPSSLIGSLGSALALRRRFRDKLRFGWRLLASPTEEDWTLVALPGPLFPLYYLLRPLRLIAKYGLRIKPAKGRELAYFVPTPQEVVDKMLAVAQVGPADVVYDLGSGDGRIVITAARRYGARGVGIELDAGLVELSRDRARRAGQESRVTFRQEDIESTDLTQATVVTMVLYPASIIALRSKLLTELRPGARIVACELDIPGWQPEETELVFGGRELLFVYLWRVNVSPVTETGQVTNTGITGTRTTPKPEE